jgi:hypothetical protein
MESTMHDPAESTARALAAVKDTMELLRMAHAALYRAKNELQGAPLDVASKLSSNLHVVRQLAEILRHELNRSARDQGLADPGKAGEVRPAAGGP